ncbi:unnamed protein product [Cylicostephanus goldi]|uniref:C2H2-type domain-containing protein n=1 Tax=Cylicostephanus goldi TaxID=71465 RepID=A0A3P6R1J3_CYLGO|nr:unnamed protein product [Cylicostephanus goldi]
MLVFLVNMLPCWCSYRIFSGRPNLVRKSFITFFTEMISRNRSHWKQHSKTSVMVCISFQKATNTKCRSRARVLFFGMKSIGKPFEFVSAHVLAGDLVAVLRGEKVFDKKRIILDSYGRDINKPRKPLPECRVGYHAICLLLHLIPRMSFRFMLKSIIQVRKLMRSKMTRCKRCKNRFIEKNIYERHLRDRHPADYTAYIEEQEAEMEQQRQEEIEANRIEELQTGGFIPPESEIEASSFEVDVERIPLPGENNGGVAPRFDQYGRLKQLKRPYKKKISPQCPFCDKRFRNEYSLKKHFVKKHSELVEFKQCTRCYKCVKDDEELENHLCELRCSPIESQEEVPQRCANSGFKCNLCNLKFLTPRKLRKHKKMSHVFTKTYQCHFCEEIFISEVAVMTHERIHTGMIKFECRICDYKANRYIQMDEHCKNEHGYICSICQEKTAEWSDMKHHTLVKHGGYLATEQNAGK